MPIAPGLWSSVIAAARCLNWCGVTAMPSSRFVALVMPSRSAIGGNRRAIEMDEQPIDVRDLGIGAISIEVFVQQLAGMLLDGIFQRLIVLGFIGPQ